MSSSGSASVFRRVRKNFKCRSHEIRPVPSLHRPSTNGAATCTRKAHAHVLPRAWSMADACTYSVRGARFFIAVQLHSLGVTDTNIHIIIARMQPGLGCLALVCSAIISCRILYCSSLESNYQRPLIILIFFRRHSFVQCLMLCWCF